MLEVAFGVLSSSPRMGGGQHLQECSADRGSGTPPPGDCRPTITGVGKGNKDQNGAPLTSRTLKQTGREEVHLLTPSALPAHHYSGYQHAGFHGEPPKAQVLATPRGPFMVALLEILAIVRLTIICRRSLHCFIA